MGSIARGFAAATLLGAAAAILAACSTDVLRPEIDVTPTGAPRCAVSMRSITALMRSAPPA